MKANFALILSYDGIRLLHRAAGGWRRVGEVSLEDPELPNALNGLREAALELEPNGLRTKLVIPGEQIKYLTIDTPEADDTARRSAARHALDGVTPYSVTELAFDISPDGDQTHVAAVAKETLTEAESFAANYRFVPISAVAIPGDEDPFLGEPFFGATGYAAGLLDDDTDVEPDFVAVVEIETPVADSEPLANVSVDDTELGAQTTPTPTTENSSGETGADSVDASAAWVPSAPDDLSSGTDPLADEAGSEELSTDIAVETADTIPDVSEAAALTEHSAFVSDHVADDASEDTSAQPSDDEDRVTTEPYIDPAEDVELVLGFSSRRKDQLSDAVPDESRVSSEPSRLSLSVTEPSVPEIEDFDAEAENTSEEDANTPSALASRLVSPASSTPLSAHDRLFATRVTRPVVKKPAAKPKTERQRMTVFGARKPDARQAAASSSRAVGLLVAAIVLISLVGVAAWATVFREDGLARFFSAPRVADTAVTLEDIAPEPEIEEPNAEIETASLEISPPEALDPVLAIPQLDLFDPETAQAHYAVTGIWTIPPLVPQAPGLLSLDDLYITSIDLSNVSFDAVALTPSDALETDAAFRAPSNPAPSGTQFALDSRGLVIPTAQGALSPTGALVFLGRPPAIPPETPDRNVQTTAQTAAQSALAAFRPRVRPEGLAENRERGQLGGISLDELAAIRPKQRPANQKLEAEEDETPTAQAAVSSKRPASRPRNFARSVAQAQNRTARTQTTDAEPPRQVAAVAPRTVTPRAPSSASAAKQATVRRAINLNRINLMGVYGTPSNRRALVRLANGRYKKVKVGDRIDGGKVSAIAESELRYQKGSRNIVLKMPNT